MVENVLRTSFRILFIFIVIICNLNPTYSQQSQKQDIAKNEVKANILFVGFGYISINYERKIKPHFGAGLDLGSSFFNPNPKIHYSILPYFRLYYPLKRNNSFFIELNGALVSSSEQKLIGLGLNYEEIEGKDFGAGIAAGWKIVTNKSLVIEMVFGVGNDFIDNYDGIFDETYYRISLSVGKSF